MTAPPGPWDGLVAAAGTPCGVYDTDAATYLGPTRALLSNAQLVRTVGARGDVIKLATAGGVALQPGWTVNIPDLPVAWLVVVKRMLLTRPFLAGPPATYAALALPYLLTFARRDRPASAASLDIYSEPLDADQGEPAMTTTRVQVPTGLSTATDPLTNEPEGPTPLGQDTAYLPLGADVQLADQVVVDGRSFEVHGLSTLYADGQAYARQALLMQTTQFDIAEAP